jgi:Tfp pilus assembly protein PilF
VKLPRILFVAALAAVALTAVFRAQTRPSVSDNREEAYRANNVGVAMLEQFNYTAAADAFRRALRLEPSLALAHLNLAIALLYVPDLDAAEKEAAEAARLLPRDPHPPYVSGLIERARGGREQQAREAFERVLQLDAKDVGTLINLGQLDLQQQRYSEAAERFRTAVAEEPYSVTATYNLGLALTRAGRREEGQKVMEQSQRLRTGGYGIVFSANYLEQGQYAEAVSSTGAEPDLVDPAVPDVTFARTPLEAPSGGARIEAITPIDFDGDGDMDLVVVTRKGLRLLRNDRGTFTDVTRSSTLGENSTDSVAAVTGDYDNDGKQDLLVLRSTATVLFHNDGNGRFSDATTRAGLPRYQGEARTAAFVDVDHDGDLDIVVGGSGPLQLIRNNGNGTFTDITSQTGVAAGGGAIAIAPTDFDNHRDIDLLVARSEGPPALFKNLRDGTFREVAADAGLRVEGATTAVATADVNKDSFPDFFFGRQGAPGTLALSDGRGRFVTKPAPAGSAGATAARFFDYDNDGLLDLLTWSADGPHLFRQVSDGWTDVTTRALGGLSPSRSGLQAQALALADVDGDGDMDVIVADGDRVDWWRNDGGSRHPSVRVRLAGRASNHDGIGAKVDIRAGSLRQRLETAAATPAAAAAAQ